MAGTDLKQTVVEKDSSVLNVPGEVKVPMETDHRNIVRYPNLHDPVPRKFLNRLARCIVDSGPWKSSTWRLPPEQKARILRDWLGVEGAPIEDVSFFSSKLVPRTCDWIKSNREFRAFLDNRSLKQPIALWVYGMPGSGKSVLASSIVQHIKDDLELPCQYFFFREEEPSKKSMVSLLKSLAFQMSSHSRQFYEHLLGLPSHKDCLDSNNPKAIWAEIFAAEMPNLEDAYLHPIYWVIDGLDVCDTAESFVSWLSDSPLSMIPLRILILSRWTEGIADAMTRQQNPFIDLDATSAKRDALQLFVEINIGKSHPLFNNIIKDAQGNFEWAHLVTENLLHRYKDLSAAEATDRAEKKFMAVWKNITIDLSARWGAHDHLVAQSTLTWVTYGRFPPTAKQVGEALTFQGIGKYNTDDLKRICGAFVMVDELSCLRFRHQSARQFLASAGGYGLCPDPISANKHLLKSCLERALSAPVDRVDYSQDSDSFLFYAITCWQYHLQNCVADVGNELLDMMEEFFTGRAVVNWIHVLARIEQLDLMRSTANALAALQLSRSAVAEKHALDSILEGWTTELVMILGKFGDRLLKHPGAIFDAVHPFCPQDSLIRGQLTRGLNAFPITIKGISNLPWDDTIARLSVSQTSSLVVCTGDYVAISSTSREGIITIMSSTNFSDVETISHGERVRTMRFSNSGKMLATYGYTTVKVWQIDVVRQLRTFEAPPAVQLMDMTFQKGDLAILACVNDGDIWKFPLLGSETTGKVLDSLCNSGDGGDPMPPVSAAFNHDGTQIAAAYRDLPLRAWSLSGTCLFRERQEPVWDSGKKSRSQVEKIQWTSNPDRILIRLQNRSLWGWDPELRSEPQFINSGVADIEGSPTRPFFVTSDDQCRWDIWKASDLSLVYKGGCEDNIRCLAICPRGRRVYGLQGSSCDVWEPNILAALAGNGEERSLAALHVLSTPGKKRLHIEPATRLPVEKLSISSRTSIYCTAHSRGELRIFDTSGKELCKVPESYSNTIIDMAWSNNEKFLAVLDVSHSSRVFEISTDQSTCTLVAETKLQGPIHQLLFKSDDNSILGASEKSIIMWNFREKSPAKLLCPISGDYRWISHPIEARYLLGISSRTICVMEWDTLEQVTQLDMSLVETPGTRAEVPEKTSKAIKPPQVVNIFESGDQSSLLVQTATEPNPRDIDLFFINVSDLTIASRGPGQEIKVRRYPPILLKMVTRPLGLLGVNGWEDCATNRVSNILVFLDMNGWLCTFHNGIVREHFFLPRSWLHPDSLDLARVTASGSLFVPKDGAVGIIMNGFRNILSHKRLDKTVDK